MNVWITGASSGIGRALALEYCRAGWRVLISARRKALLDELSVTALERFPSSPAMEVLPLDYRDRQSFPGIVSRIDSLLDPDQALDLVILNAGQSQRSWFRDTGMTVVDDLIELNLSAPMALSSALLPLMKKRGGGRIAAVGSLAGLVPAPLRSAYAAAKHGLHGFFKTLDVEESAQGIAVSLIIPGFVRSDISLNALDGAGRSWEKMDGELAAGQRVELAAARIRRGLDKKKARIYTGYTPSLLLARLLEALSPGMLRRVLIKRFAKTNSTETSGTTAAETARTKTTATSRSSS